MKRSGLMKMMMMTVMRAAILPLAVLAFVLLPAAAAFADAPKVTASTAWTGALAEAAGADVDVLAGYELRHPPEYDFSPRDIQRAVEADFIVWGGYEGFIRNLVEAADIPDEKVVQVRTNNSPPLMREAVRVLAERFGTMDAYEAFADELDAKAQELLDAAEAAEVASVRVAVNGFYEPLIEWLGYDIVAVFGPGEPTTGTITEVEERDPDLIIDNWHVPLGKPFDTEERDYVQLINFPGHAGTRDLIDVLDYYERTLGLSGGGG